MNIKELKAKIEMAIEKIELGKGDIIILRMSGLRDIREIDKFHDYLKESSRIAGLENRVMVIDKDAEIVIVSKDDSD